MLKIKRGDALPLVTNLFIGKHRADPDVDAIHIVEFAIPGLEEKEWNSEGTGTVEYDSETKQFRVPLTQEETFSFECGDELVVDIRVQFDDGTVYGVEKPPRFRVIPAVSDEVLS